MAIQHSSEHEPRPITASQLAALLLWMGPPFLSLILTAVIVIFSPSLLSALLSAMLVALAFIPVDPESSWGKALGRFVCPNAMEYFPIKVIYQDRAEIDFDRPYVIAAEPHSIFPLGLMSLMEHNPNRAFRQVRLGATGIIFFIPIVRHIWSWLSITQASRSNLRRLLRDNFSVAIVPGGVQECLHMRQGEEVIFLRKRFGFVKLAIEEGAPLVPIFVFGQSATYSWWKPSGPLYEAISRRIGFAPLAFWGVAGSPIPFRSQMTVVVGRPIVVQKCPNPTKEQVAALHATFLSSMERLFHEFKQQIGLSHLKLRIL